MNEDVVQRSVVKLYQAYGGQVYNLSQGYRPGPRRHATTRQSEGLPDLWVFFLDSGFRIWHETKAFDGDDLRPHLPRLEVPWSDLVHDRRKLNLALKHPQLYAAATTLLEPAKRIELYRKKQTAAQILFEQCCRRCRITYVLGGVEEAYMFVEAQKLIIGGKT